MLLKIDWIGWKIRTDDFHRQFKSSNKPLVHLWLVKSIKS